MKTKKKVRSKDEAVINFCLSDWRGETLVKQFKVGKYRVEIWKDIPNGGLKL